MVRQVLITDSQLARPRPGELVVVLGGSGPRHGRNAARVLTVDQAIELVGEAAQVRVALAEPLVFLRRLAASRAGAARQAA